MVVVKQSFKVMSSFLTKENARGNLSARMPSNQRSFQKSACVPSLMYLRDASINWDELHNITTPKGTTRVRGVRGFGGVVSVPNKFNPGDVCMVVEFMQIFQQECSTLVFDVKYP